MAATRQPSAFPELDSYTTSQGDDEGHEHFVSGSAGARALIRLYEQLEKTLLPPPSNHQRDDRDDDVDGNGDNDGHGSGRGEKKGAGGDGKGGGGGEGNNDNGVGVGSTSISAAAAAGKGVKNGGDGSSVSGGKSVSGGGTDVVDGGFLMMSPTNKKSIASTTKTVKIKKQKGQRTHVDADEDDHRKTLSSPVRDDVRDERVHDDGCNVHVAAKNDLVTSEWKQRRQNQTRIVRQLGHWCNTFSHQRRTQAAALFELKLNFAPLPELDDGGNRGNSVNGNGNGNGKQKVCTDLRRVLALHRRFGSGFRRGSSSTDSGSDDGGQSGGVVDGKTSSNSYGNSKSVRFSGTRNRSVSATGSIQKVAAGVPRTTDDDALQPRVEHMTSRYQRIFMRKNENEEDDRLLGLERKEGFSSKGGGVGLLERIAARCKLYRFD